MSETLATASEADLAFWNNKVRPTAKALKHFGLDKSKPRRKYKKKSPPPVNALDQYFAHDIIVRSQMTRFGLVCLFERHLSEYTGVSWGQVTSRERRRKVAMVRQAVMYLLDTRTNSSLGEIGRAVCRPDHSTIIYGIKCVRASLFGSELPKGTTLRKDYRPIIRSLESLIIQEGKAN